ncbi:MAG TPA: hypothetical protein DCL61_05015 [Cyanobacteria bacterium UBA12227]|nr:hypothetical protein [Cyanobacteria bacterium UBA12227]HAX84758.1 hypothetical protein [Cyanobacteria bacterium UBA11370]HBY81566.1 hypothetical protein [Cyanobacteria bacterium UBA11148]
MGVEVIGLAVLPAQLVRCRRSLAARGRSLFVFLFYSYTVSILYLYKYKKGTIMKIDYSKVSLQKVKNPRFQTQPLPDKDYYDLKVIAELLNKPVSQVIGNAINTYLYRNSENHTERLQFKAAQEGKTMEEIYQELASGEVDE